MIIIYGGAFNPPTKAHYLISKKLIVWVQLLQQTTDNQKDIHRREKTILIFQVVEWKTEFISR